VSLPAVVPRGPVALLGLVDHFVHDDNCYLFSLLSCTFLFSCKATMHSGKKELLACLNGIENVCFLLYMSTSYSYLILRS
jgi:hypothetical protein